MHIIPVVDLRGGRAVAARQGRRRQYQPLSTPLCPDGSARTLVAAYRYSYGFRTIYIADLDAIEGTGDNAALIRALIGLWPDCDFWCDLGLAADDITDCSSSGRETGSVLGLPILGSESQNDWRAVQRAAAERPAAFILSLDSQGDRFLGPDQLWSNAACWPDRVIVMTLDRVGSAEGPAAEKLKTILNRSEGRRIYAAGGVQNADDLDALAVAGVDGALIATALHDGRLSPVDIKRRINGG